jgi:hypothetical protein
MWMAPILFMLLFLGAKFNVLYLNELPYALGYYFTKVLIWMF